MAGSTDNNSSEELIEVNNKGGHFFKISRCLFNL
jgi:hypothetical protein